MHRKFTFDSLHEADLHVDAVYEGGTAGNTGDDPIGPLTGTGNQGGFRFAGSPRQQAIRLVVLYSSLVELDWPDSLDMQSGRFVYFGDNRSPGKELHETQRRGNLILRQCFDALHAGRRSDLPPFLVFTKSGRRRDVLFRGLAVPGAPGMPSTQDLVAVWKSKNGVRFQNYRAVFTLLDEPVVHRAWLKEIHAGTRFGEHCPIAFRQWANKGSYQTLSAEPTASIRSRREQLPDGARAGLVRAVYESFRSNPFGFELIAAEMFRISDPNVVHYDLTRPWRDGGRDALGNYRIGHEKSAVVVDFALEAKCYAEGTAVGVSELSRLISRLRYRQFGVLVTTSYVHEQAYKEVVEDGHPVLIIAAVDIARILVEAGMASEESVKNWVASVMSSSRNFV